MDGVYSLQYKNVLTLEDLRETYCQMILISTSGACESGGLANGNGSRDTGRWDDALPWYKLLYYMLEVAETCSRTSLSHELKERLLDQW